MELVVSVSVKVCVLNKPGGGKNMNSLFEGFHLCQCAFQGQTKKSGWRGG